MLLPPPVYCISLEHRDEVGQYGYSSEAHQYFLLVCISCARPTCNMLEHVLGLPVFSRSFILLGMCFRASSWNKVELHYLADQKVAVTIDTFS